MKSKQLPPMWSRLSMIRLFSPSSADARSATTHPDSPHPTITRSYPPSLSSARPCLTFVGAFGVAGGGIATISGANLDRQAVVSFDQHPAAVVRPENAPLLLTDHDQRIELFDDGAHDALFRPDRGP